MRSSWLINLKQVDIHANIKLLVKTWYDDDDNRLLEPEKRMVETTVGRVIFNRILPPKIQFVNWVLDKGGLKDLMADLYEVCGEEQTPDIADAIKDIGFKYATRSGYSLAVSDITVPLEKEEIIASASERPGERAARFPPRPADRAGTERAHHRDLAAYHQPGGECCKAIMDPDGNLAAQAISGATKGGFGPISQLAGMRGLMADPSGRIIPLPIRSNFREGLTALEYFISTHGARKGLADTALRTADAGYLTRRLVDVAQDVIINDEDCGTQDGIWIRRSDDIAGQSMGSRLVRAPDCRACRRSEDR